MALLAIKGHPTRGEEVIEILEMLGGINYHNYSANCDSLCFYIGKGINWIYYVWLNNCHDDEDIIVFTLEEFLKKFPYKIGNKILYKTYGIYLRIKTMLWNVEKEQVFYRLESNKLFVATADELQPCKEETIENKLDLLQQLKDYFDNTPREVVEKEWHEYDEYNKIGPTVDEYLEYVNKIRQLKYPKIYNKSYDEETTNKAIFDCNAQCCDIMNSLIKEETMEEKIKIDIPKGYEFTGVDDDNQQVVFEKIGCQYPKTYEECCEVLMGKTNFSDFSLVLTKLSIRKNKENSISPEPPYISLINKFYKLLICRDAYWKIARAQMGLGKPWEPDWLNTAQDKFVLYTHDNLICLNCFVLGHNVLAFPTKEMRDAFYENFKDLIEQCKEFL